MCGIVGYIGSESAVENVIKGLSKLEYRGYDSAGISFISKDNNLETYKEEGRLKNLEQILQKVNYESNASIGHTRWATHGEVNKTNSHPHFAQSFSVVHNGIIENSNEIKEKLISEGRQFLSDTDSEVFVRLLEKELPSSASFKEAIYKTFNQLSGNSAFVILDQAKRRLFAIRNNAPLVCGTDENGSNKLVSSDAYALMGHANTIYFPDNGVLCELLQEHDDILFYDENLNKTNKYKREKNISIEEDFGKGEFEHYMLKEIHEQPELINDFCFEYFDLNKYEKSKVSGAEKIYITACGTAYYAGLVTRDFLEKYARIPTAVEVASEFRYRNPILSKDDLCLLISQSGETADTLAALDLAKENKSKTLAILNVANSSIDRESDQSLLIYAGQEIGVASTKAFTLQCLTGRLLSNKLSSNPESEETLKKKLQQLSISIRRVLDRSGEISKIAAELYLKQAYFFTGRGELYPMALEGALKLKEIAYVHAEGYAAGELKHGPIAIIDENVVNVAYIGNHLVDKTISNIQEIKARRGIVFTIGNTSDPEVQKISDYQFSCDLDGLDEFAPILLNVVGQLFSYYIAKYKGTDIDKPRNLAKSVTVE